MKIISKEILEYAGKSNFKEIIISLINFILDTNKNVQIAIKWRAITFTINNNWHHWICNISATNDKVSLYFHKGSLLQDPKNILQGKGKALRKIDILDVKSIDRPYIKKLFKDAVNKQLDMPENVNM